MESSAVEIPTGDVTLNGNLDMPVGARGIVLFAHGSGSSRLSPRNQFVARTLRQSGLATLLFDLLTAEEETVDLRTSQLRFDIGFLAERLLGATAWLKAKEGTERILIGYFGSSTGAGAALVAAAERPAVVSAIVSRGGRPDLAGAFLPLVQAPTLLIVGGDDGPVISMNRDAMRQMRTETKLEIIPGATHLFEEPGTLERVAELAAEWFRQKFREASNKV